MSAILLSVTEGNFQTEVAECEVPVLVDFWAEWCGPCKSLSSTLEEVQRERHDTVKICRVDVAEEQELAAQFGVRNLPTVLFFKRGQPIAHMVGNQSKQTLLKAIDAITSQETRY